jgi:transposase
LISEMGDDRTRFPSPDALLAEAGLAPITKASGRTRQVRFRYAANRRMRHVIDWWVFVAAREDPWSKTVYETSRARGQRQVQGAARPGRPLDPDLVALLDRSHRL